MEKKNFTVIEKGTETGDDTALLTDKPIFRADNCIILTPDNILFSLPLYNFFRTEIFLNVCIKKEKT